MEEFDLLIPAVEQINDVGRNSYLLMNVIR